VPRQNKSLPKPPPKKKKKAKRLEVEAAAVARGTEIGKAQAHKKKSLVESAKEHIGHWIDNIDPLELAATLSLTVIVHGVIMTSDSMLTQMANFVSNVPEAVGGMAQGVLEGIFSKQNWEALGITVSEGTEPTTQPQPKSHYISILEDLGITDFYVWVGSFALAFVMIKHGGQIVGLLDKGITGIVGLMLA